MGLDKLDQSDIFSGMRSGLLVEKYPGKIEPTNYGKYASVIDKLNKQITILHEHGTKPTMPELLKHRQMILEAFKYLNLEIGDTYAR